MTRRREIKFGDPWEKIAELNWKLNLFSLLESMTLRSVWPAPFKFPRGPLAWALKTQRLNWVSWVWVPMRSDRSGRGVLYVGSANQSQRLDLRRSNSRPILAFVDERRDIQFVDEFEFQNYNAVGNLNLHSNFQLQLLELSKRIKRWQRAKISALKKQR